MTTDQTTRPDEHSVDLDDAIDHDDEVTDTDDHRELDDHREHDDSDSDVDTDAEVGDDSVPPATKRRLFSTTVGVAIVGVLLVAAASVTAWLYFGQYRPSQQTGPAAADSALQAARDGTVALLSYAPDTLDADLTAAKSHLTGEFLTYYTQFTDQIVKPAATEKQVETTATVVRAAVSDIQPDKATVLAFVNQTTLSAERPDPELANSSVLINLTKVDGKWLISEFKPV